MKSQRHLGPPSDERFIPNVSWFCDEWCQRCPVSNRCLDYAHEKVPDDCDLEAHDLSNQKFWARLQFNFYDTVEMLREEAKARGIDPGDPKLKARIRAQERAQLAAKKRPLLLTVMLYRNAVDEWFVRTRRRLRAKGCEWEWESLKWLDTGDPLGQPADLAELAELVDVVRRYQDFIYLKLCEAIKARADEKRDEADWGYEFLPKESDGWAKICMVAINRCIAAWSGLRTALGDDHVLDLMAQLEGIRRETERLFPESRAVLRPGFDDIPDVSDF